MKGEASWGCIALTHFEGSNGGGALKHEALLRDRVTDSLRCTSCPDRPNIVARRRDEATSSEVERKGMRASPRATKEHFVADRRTYAGRRITEHEYLPQDVLNSIGTIVRTTNLVQKRARSQYICIVPMRAEKLARRPDQQMLTFRQFKTLNSSSILAGASAPHTRSRWRDERAGS